MSYRARRQRKQVRAILQAVKHQLATEKALPARPWLSPRLFRKGVPERES
jgi:hypothetical protein